MEDGLLLGVSNGSTFRGNDASLHGGAGGGGKGIQGNTTPNAYGGGGAGNKGGKGTYSSRYFNSFDWEEGNGENGTGGLLAIYADVLNNRGQIVSNGSNGGPFTSNLSTLIAGGGGSRAEALSIYLLKKSSNQGQIQQQEGKVDMPI